MTINLSSASGTYQVEWYRPSDGATQSAGTVNGGSSHIFTAPWQGTDVVLRLTFAPTTPPAIPTNLAASGGNSQVSLSWSAASGASTYNIYRSTTSGGEGPVPVQI